MMRERRGAGFFRHFVFLHLLESIIRQSRRGAEVALELRALTYACV
jgi:hypothetical protein